MLREAAICVAAAVVLLVAFHGFGIVNFEAWLFKNQETQRFVSLKKDPYANELFEA
jgi:hypothetical protein